MKEQKRDIAFSLILVAVSGFVFFSLGLFAAWKWGFAEQRVLIQYEVTDPSTTTSTTTASLQVDLNTATVDDLMQIDGIGEKTAEKIIQYRTTIGKYTFIEQLLDVEGVGEKKLEGWKAYLVLESTDNVTTTTTTARINLNTATVHDLMRIDGLGEKTAQKIIQYRTTIGEYISIEQLLNVEGVGEKKLEAWKSYLYVETDDLVPTTTTIARIDLNTATVDDLMQIDGLGEKTAQKIIQYRTTIGKYTSIEQLLDVEGVGEKKLSGWKAFLFVETVDGVPTTTSKTLIDLNAATVQDLMGIDGIGEKTAQKIIQYRETIGKYTSIEQLLDVEGVGEKKLSGWKAYLFVETVDSVSTTTTKTLINLNTATVQDLMRIDGIGEKTAQKIIDYRESIGGFTSLEQLMDVDGVGEKKFNAWRQYLTIN